MFTGRLLLVRQDFPDMRIADVAGEARTQMEASGLAAQLQPGARVAVGVGSRGISNLASIVGAVVRYWLDRGMKPFVFPAMGSHGAATAEGQARVLAHLGITESSVGCPIVSRVDVVSLGRTGDGIEVFMDEAAYSSDGVMLVGRVKWHTNFVGAIESGLMKMMAIGLGKFAGARMYHARAQQLGMEHVIRTVGRHMLRTGRIVGGMAIVEDAHHNTAKLEAVPAACMEQREEANLALAKSWMPRLPCDVDVLVVDQIGKNISGTGMDAKVVNRGTRSEYNPWPGLPKVERIFARELARESYGNAVGIGLADVTTDRLLGQIDWKPTAVNAQTAGSPSRIRVPVHFATDRECLEWVASTVGKASPSEVTYAWIRNTLELTRIAISVNLETEIARRPAAAVEREIDVPWDARGDLISPFQSLHLL